MKSLTEKLTLEQIRILGFEALCEKLGPASAIRFVRQYELGSGDYTVERQSILKGLSLQDALRLTAQQRSRPARRRAKQR